MNYSWEELARLAGGRLLQSGTQRPVRAGVDSRGVSSGDLFVALAGEKTDGHVFLSSAVANGAAGALVSQETEGIPDGFGVIRCEDTLTALQRLATAHRSHWGGRVVGVTGSNGKTTTKEILAHLLRSFGKKVLATRGNLNSRIGLPLMLLELEPEHTHAVLEMGASATGDIARLAAMAQPHLGVVTGIGRAHLEFFGEIESVADAKWELVTALGESGVAFLNADDPRLMARRPSARCGVVTFGQAPVADVRGETLRQDPQTTFDLVAGLSRRSVRLPVPGLFNVTNALAAVSVALWERGTFLDLVRGLETFAPPPDRMQMRRRADGSLFVTDAYNANPDSMEASVSSFVEAFPYSPRVVVLGSMKELGDASSSSHRELGERLAQRRFFKIFFLGPEGADVQTGYERSGGKDPLWIGEDPTLLSKELAACLTPETAVLFKASRSVRLESVFEPLLISH